MIEWIVFVACIILTVGMAIWLLWGERKELRQLIVTSNALCVFMFVLGLLMHREKKKGQ